MLSKSTAASAGADDGAAGATRTVVDGAGTLVTCLLDGGTVVFVGLENNLEAVACSKTEASSGAEKNRLRRIRGYWQNLIPTTSPTMILSYKI